MSQDRWKRALTAPSVESIVMKLVVDCPSSLRSAVIVSGLRSLHGPCTTWFASG